MNKFFGVVATVTTGLLLAGCVAPPEGPSVVALPGSNKSYQQFRYDEMSCRHEASGSLAGASAQSSQNAVASATTGTLIGAAAGALIGAASGHAGPGALIGAGSGLLIGSAAASGQQARSERTMGEDYDTQYVQCMYARGNRVPVSGVVTDEVRQPPDYNNTAPAAAVPPDYVPAGSAPSGTPPDYVPAG